MDEQRTEPVGNVAGPAVQDEKVKAPGSRAGRVWAVVAVLAVAAICGYVSIRANSDSAPAPARASTCDEWAGRGTANKTIQAREMLTALRQKDGLGAPETTTAQRFADGLTNVCASSASGARLSEIAATLYLTERGTFG